MIAFMSKFKSLQFKDSVLSMYREGKTYVDIAKTLYPQSLNIRNDAQNIRRLVIHFLGSQEKRLTYLQSNVDEVRKLLLDGKTPTEIAKTLNVKCPTITSFIHSNFPEYTFKYNHGNSHYFDTIDSASKAYIVGFIAADGCLVSSNHKESSYTLTITVKDSDVDILTFIKSELSCNNPIVDIVRPSGFNKSKIIHHKRFTITDVNISNALLKLGISPRKSLTMANIIENIPYEYRDAFIIGYFDGDGSVSTYNKMIKKPNNSKAYPSYSLFITFRGTEEFLSGICQHLNISTSHIHKYDSIATLGFASKKDTMRLYKCYENLQFFYKRKHDKFLLRINHPSYDKYR